MIIDFILIWVFDLLVLLDLYIDLILIQLLFFDIILEIIDIEVTHFKNNSFNFTKFNSYFFFETKIYNVDLNINTLSDKIGKFYYFKLSKVFLYILEKGFLEIIGPQFFFFIYKNIFYSLNYLNTFFDFLSFINFIIIITIILLSLLISF
jgi:hypothetical protein